MARKQPKMETFEAFSTEDQVAVCTFSLPLGSTEAEQWEQVELAMGMDRSNLVQFCHIRRIY